MKSPTVLGSPVAWVATALFCSYAAVCVFPYLWSDDYANLALARGPGEIWKLPLLGGRPLYGALLSFGFEWAESVRNLRWLRAVGLASLFLLALAFRSFLIRRSVDSVIATALAVSLAVLPAYQVYVAWATAYVFPLASLLGLGAAAVLVFGRPESLSRRAVRLLCSGLLLLLGLFIYQPAAMLFVVCIWCALLHGSEGGAERRRLVGGALAALGLASLAAYASIHVVNGLWGGSNLARTTLTLAPFQKLGWFVQEPLVNALNLFSIHGNRALAVLVALFVCSGMVAGAPSVRAGVQRVLAALLAMLCSYAPNLAVAESWASYRTIAALSAMVLVCVWMAFSGFASKFRAPPWVSRGFAVALATCGVAMGTLSVSRYFVAPQLIEWTVLQHEVGRVGLSGGAVCFVPARLDDAPAPSVRYDEFGRPSTFAPWAQDNAVRVAADELGIERARLAVTVRPGCSDEGAGTTVVDMRRIRDFRGRF